MNNGDVTDWFSIDGDNTLRVEYPLNQDSIVIDIGAYRGDWAKKIYDRYKCVITAYEPVSENYKISYEAIKGLDKVCLKYYGVGKKRESIEISLLADGSSLFREGERKERIELYAVEDELQGKIDLLKINVEGGEYDILDELIRLGRMPDISNFQVQFHRFVNDYEERYNTIAAALAQTHELTYRFPFVWENWRLK